MIIKNGRVLDTQMKKFYPGDLWTRGGRIVPAGTAAEAAGEEVIDASGQYVIPGLVDIHTHGARGVDILKDAPSKIREMSAYYASRGVTTVFPTTLTAEKKVIAGAIRNICAADEDNLISFRGIHIEGPYLSGERAGTHDISLLKKPDLDELKEYLDAAGGRRVYLTVASELEGALDFIAQAVKMGVRVSLGHTDATGDNVRQALSRGAVSFTHLYNAMRPVHHREPGVVGQALASDAYTELICDGHHIHPDVVLMTYRMKTEDRLLLVTDSMSAAGMPDGDYLLGDIPVCVVDGAARNPDGNLAGSTLNLYDGVRNLMRFASASFVSAVLCATRNPAMAANLYGEVGSLSPGKAADIVLVNEDYSIDRTIAKGRTVYKA